MGKQCPYRQQLLWRLYVAAMTNIVASLEFFMVMRTCRVSGVMPMVAVGHLFVAIVSMTQYTDIRADGIHRLDWMVRRRILSGTRWLYGSSCMLIAACVFSEFRIFEPDRLSGYVFWTPLFVLTVVISAFGLKKISDGLAEPFPVD